MFLIEFELTHQCDSRITFTSEAKRESPRILRIDMLRGNTSPSADSSMSVIRDVAGIIALKQRLKESNNQGDHGIMLYNIHWKNDIRSEATEVYARKQANSMLSRFAERIRAVSLKFEDLNGPKGGVDKRCTVEIVGQFAPLFASANATNYFIASNRAIGKLKRGVVRALERQLY